MNATAVLERLSAQGVQVTPRPNGNLWLEPASKIPPDLLEAVRENKPAILALLGQERPPSPLPDPKAAVAEIDRLLALGQRLKRGEVKALRCGITGQICVCCAGVPCWGSTAWGA